MTQLTFGQALEALKEGKRVARTGWNGKGMWIVLMSGMSLPPYNTQGTERKVNDRTAKWIGKDTPLETLPYIAIWTTNSVRVDVRGCLVGSLLRQICFQKIG